MQKKCVRIIAGADYREHTNQLYSELQILKLDDIYQIEICKIVLKHLQNSLPTPLSHIFILNSEIYERETRRRHDFHTRKCRTTLATQNVLSKGPHIWNALPSHVKDLTHGTTANFVNKLQKYILQGYCD